MLATPYHLIFKTSVDYSSLRVFGCLCFAYTLMSHRTKFFSRARVCVFVGYPLIVKGYKILFLSHSLCLEMYFSMNHFSLFIMLLILMIFLIFSST